MKKYFVLLFVLSSVFVFAKEKLISSTPVELKEAFIPQEVPYKSTITYEELLEDLDMTVYYLETVYAGYDTMKKNGFDAQNFKKTISKKYNNDEIIDTQRVFVDILEKLQGYVKDRHLSVVKNQDDNNFEIGNTTDSNLFFHTNVYLEKINSEFYVQESENIELLKGTKYTGSKENLFYYPVKGTNSYILGLIAIKNPNVFQFSFGNKEISLNTYDDGNINSSKAIKYHELETKNSGYVSISSFYMPDVNSQYYKGANLVFNKYANLFQKWNSKKNIIIDLRGNSGGLSEFHEYLIYSMLQKNPKDYSTKNYNKCYSWFCENFYDLIKLESPAILQAELKEKSDVSFIKSYEKKYEMIKHTPLLTVYSNDPLEKNDNSKSNYQGNIVVLIDRNSASASEIVAVLSKEVLDKNKVFIIGENSMGCCDYWESLDYSLPNTGLYLHLSSMKNNSFIKSQNWHGETFGVYPDYWSLGKDLNDTIFLVTQDEVMKEKLKGIENRLM